MTYVLDASAMIAFLTGERGDDVVAQLLSDPINRVFAHAVNLCEVYYHALRSSARAPTVLRELRRAGVRTRRDMNVHFCAGVGELKATCKASLGDCFGMQLARTLESPFVTSDHHELDDIARRRICKVLFIR